MALSAAKVAVDVYSIRGRGCWCVAEEEGVAVCPVFAEDCGYVLY